MATRSDEKRYPSVEQFEGWYNLGYERKDGLPVLHTAGHVPEFEPAELLELYAHAATWFSELVRLPPDLPFDPLAVPPFFVRSDTDDRTLDVETNFDYLTIGLIDRIQQQFLASYPLWRVVLIAEHPSCSIVVYPNAVRFGNFPLGVDPQEALRELVPRAAALCERRLRPRRAYLAHVQRILHSAVQRIGDRPFLVCGILDNYEGDYSRTAICLLIRGSDVAAVTIEGPPGAEKDLLWRATALGVDSNGAIVSYIGVPKTAPFCFAAWLPPAEYRGPVMIVDKVTGRRHVYKLSSEDIARTDA